MTWFEDTPAKDGAQKKDAARAMPQRIFGKSGLLDIAAASLIAHKVRYRRNDERHAIDFTVSLRLCRRMGGVRVVIVPVGTDSLMIYTICPQRAKPEQLAAAAEYITRANYGLRIGAFEMDYRIGQIRYKACLMLHGIVPPDKIVSTYISMGFLMMDRFGEGLLRVLIDGEAPESAVPKIRPDSAP